MILERFACDRDGMRCDHWRRLLKSLVFFSIRPGLDFGGIVRICARRPQRTGERHQYRNSEYTTYSSGRHRNAVLPIIRWFILKPAKSIKVDTKSNFNSPDFSHLPMLLQSKISNAQFLFNSKT